MTVHFLSLRSPTGSVIRSVLDADGGIVPWPSPTSSASRPLSMSLVERGAAVADHGGTVLVDSDGRHWTHPAHRPVVLRDERAQERMLLDPSSGARISFHPL